MSPAPPRMSRIGGAAAGVTTVPGEFATKPLWRLFLSPRFFKFALVGLTGVGVNLTALHLLADRLAFHANIASATAIEISILSNFALNEMWTFDGIPQGTRRWENRLVRFHVVSAVGGFLQWAVFVFGNIAWFQLTAPAAASNAYFQDSGSVLMRYLVHPIGDPPPVGVFKYVSQLTGIAVAMGWNFLANWRWTWGGGQTHAH